MKFLRHKYLLAPIFILSAAFLADKIFLIPSIQNRLQAWNKIEPTFYESRYWLFEQLVSDYPLREKNRERLGIIFGTSRAGEFNNQDIQEILPDSYTYNFSAPFASPSFHYYWMKRILDSGMKIDLALLEMDPLLIGQDAIRYSLSYSYDPNFVIKNTEIGRTLPRNPKNINSLFESGSFGFSFDETETYFLKQLFAVYKYPPDLGAIAKNSELHPLLMKTGLDFKAEFVEQIKKGNRVNLGGIPNPMVVQIPPEELQRIAKEDAKKLLDNFSASSTQIGFFKKMVDTLAANGVRTVIYWPISSRPFYEAMKDKEVVDALQDSINRYIATVKEKYPKAYLELKNYNDSKELTCRFFLDSHHLSGKCYKELTELLLKDFK